MTDLIDTRVLRDQHATGDPRQMRGRVSGAISSWECPEFWMTFWMAVFFAVAKISQFDLSKCTNATRRWELAHDAVIATAADNFFALCLGFAATLTLKVLSRRPRWRRIGYFAWATFSGVCVFYAIANACVYHFIRMPITRELLHAAGYWADMKSSWRQLIDFNLIRALIGGPILYLLLTSSSNRFIGVPRSRLVRAAIATLVFGMLVQLSYAVEVKHAWEQRPDHRLAMNPHWTLVSTYLFGSGDVKVHFPKDIPADFDTEFQPMRVRGGRGAATGSYPLPFSSRPKHVIVYVMESVGAQFLHLYGSHYLTTPHLDAEAAHSLIFDNFYAHVGQTRRAMVSINTSNQARPEWQPQLYDPQHALNQPGIQLNEILKGHGFRSLAITSSDFNHFAQEDFLKAGNFDAILSDRDLKGNQISSWGKDDSTMVDKLLDWIGRDPAHAQPFFALCWTNQTHHPYALSQHQKEVNLLGAMQPPFPADIPSINRELNCLLDADFQIERMLNGLRDRGIADDTLVVITGDHGEGFNWPHDSIGHGFRIYQENLHIPCILWNPRLLPKNRRSDLVSGQIDLAPTIVDALGFEPAGTWQGHSLFDPLHPSRVYFYGSYDEILIGVRERNWKYICNAYTGFQELYNLSTDPTEQFNIATKNPTVCRDLSLRDGAWLAHLDRFGAAVRP